jgi:hypothetical protein
VRLAASRFAVLDGKTKPTDTAMNLPGPEILGF